MHAQVQYIMWNGLFWGKRSFSDRYTCTFSLNHLSMKTAVASPPGGELDNYTSWLLAALKIMQNDHRFNHVAFIKSKI